ncbi:hypothetical protein [Lonepinella koalarum]|uniref:hypothetical protein n=1 Tax=Lonepinella koalarum TaxID=53417 RepID=UPI001073128B|nr:hypothetical protein [Lonepinella koalarum]TFJ88776.1 hypothetical protein E0709_12070 [Lonepinella koalarum]
MKEVYYTELQSVMDRCPRRDTLLVMGDFNVSTSTARDGYESCIGPHGSGSRDQSASMLLDFAKSRGLRVAGSWFERPDARRWTWYSNTGVVAKEIDHVLVDGRWRLLQNCRVYRSAQFLNTDHRLVVATLKLKLKSQRMQTSSQLRLDVGQLRDERVAEEFAHKLQDSFKELGDGNDSEELWSNFKTKILKVEGEGLETSRKTRRGFLTPETMDIIEKSRRARLESRTGHYKAVKRASVRALGMDEEEQVRGICETIGVTTDRRTVHPACIGIRILRSSKTSLH